MRLEYETCDPCFFWYGDGHGSTSDDRTHAHSNEDANRGPGEETTQDMGRNEKGDCLSWEVFADEDVEGSGCRVWVERVEVERVEVEGLLCRPEGLKRGHSWREALEPIARPCEFWGTFLVK